MTRQIWRTSWLLTLMLFTVAAYCQTPGVTQPNVVLLTVSGEVATPLKLTAADLAKLPHRSLTARTHDGKEASFAGVELGEVLKLAGVKSGEQLRGKELALFLVVEAADQYRAVFALAELDHAFTDRVVLLTDQRDGKPLSEKEGPLRLVAPDEKREGRWVRQVIALKVQRAAN